MPFKHCAIVGLGLLGGSLAIDLRRQYPAMAITGIARRLETLEEAAGLRSEDQPVFTGLSLDLTAVRLADLVVLCTPVLTIVQQLARIAPLLSPGTVVTDVGSTKRMIMNAASTVLPPTVTFIGGHPLAGSEKTGVTASRANLYANATWALCVPAGQEEAATRLADMLATIGANPVMVDADTHDDIAALVSHVPHIIAAAMVDVGLGSAHGDAVLPFIAGGFRDTTRIAASSPAMWRDIFLSNKEHVLAGVDALLHNLEEWRTAIASSDGPVIEALFTRAALRRRRLP